MPTKKKPSKLTQQAVPEHGVQPQPVPDELGGSLESSVRLSRDAFNKYTEMAEGNSGQKTDVLSHAAFRLAEIVASRPQAFRGGKRPWAQRDTDKGN